jgi:hypothetical protein
MNGVECGTNISCLDLMYYINVHVKERKKTKKKLRTVVNRNEFRKWGLPKAMQKRQAVRQPFRQIPNLSQILITLNQRAA